MRAILVLAALLGQGAGDTCDVLLKELESIDAANPVALLEFGQRCESKRCAGLARLAYERILKSGKAKFGAQSVCEATYRLARSELAKRKPDYEKAFSSLRGVVLDCPEHKAAHALLRRAETDKTRKQVLLVKQADELFEKEQHKRALTLYEQAFQLSPEKPTASAYVSRSAILGKLAACRDRLDDQVYEREYLPRKRSVISCPVCSTGTHKGFLTCQTCRGTGLIRRIVRRGTVARTETFMCPKCKQHGYQGCSACFALGYGSREITRKEKDALKDVVLSAAHPMLFKQPLESACETVDKLLQRVEEGATLNYLRAMKPDYSLSRTVRDGLQRVPAGLGSTSKAASAWRAAASDTRLKVNFLLNYACEYADYIRHFDMLRNTASPETETLLSTDDWEGTFLTPELLSAFPDEGDLSCVAVEGILKGCKKGGTGEYKDDVELLGEIPHNVRFFVWRPSAKRHIERLKNGLWGGALEELYLHYPYQVGDALRDAPNDHRTVVVGRFLRDRLGYPRNWFEIWRFETGLSAEQEKLYRQLAHPVDIVFPDLTLEQIGRILQDWFDIRLDLEGVDREALVQCEATECPKGLMIHSLARRILSKDWYVRGNTVTFCSQGRNPRDEDMTAVLRKLLKTRSADARIVVRRGKVQGRGQDPGAPSLVRQLDTAGLRVRLHQAMTSMRYGEALACLESLEKKTSAGAAREAVEQSLAKNRLLQRLSGRTPVSRLVGAPKLAEIVYEKSTSGDLVKRLVVVERSGEAVWLQESYGARFQIDPKLIRQAKAVSASEWKRDNDAELGRREAALKGLDPEEKVRKLFFLALFAKTHNYLEEGNRFLNEAIATERFKTFLEQFFPEESSGLSVVWRRATGRQDPELAPGSVTPSVPEVARPEVAPSAAGPPPTVTVEPLPPSLSEAELLDYARTYAREGNQCTRRVLEGENAGEWRKLAIQNFSQAEAALEKLLELRPGDQGTRSRLLSVRAVKDACYKDMDFFTR